jgi:hypothetical protein
MRHILCRVGLLASDLVISSKMRTFLIRAPDRNVSRRMGCVAHDFRKIRCMCRMQPVTCDERQSHCAICYVVAGRLQHILKGRKTTRTAMTCAWNILFSPTLSVDTQFHTIYDEDLAPVLLSLRLLNDITRFRRSSVVVRFAN